MNEKWDNLAEILKTSNSIVFFGGAGTSTESGIPDFRGKDGLYSRKYKGYDPEEILHIDFFLQNATKSGVSDNDLLQLQGNSQIALKTKTKESTGLQNTFRIGFAVYDDDGTAANTMVHA